MTQELPTQMMLLERRLRQRDCKHEFHSMRIVDDNFYNGKLQSKWFIRDFCFQCGFTQDRDIKYGP